VDGEIFEGGSIEDAFVELGSGQFIPGFEDQLIGVRSGDNLKFNVTFPESYAVASLAGRPAEFDVNVKEVQVPQAQNLDDEFAKKVGFDSIEKLKEMVASRLENEFARLTAMKLKRDVLDALDKSYSFDLPEKLVDAEFSGIWNALTSEMNRTKRSFADEGTTEEDARKEYRAIAERRVRLGLVLGTMGEREGIKIADEELQRALIERARQFPGQEKQVFDYYRKNPRALVELRGPIFEQKVVDSIVSKAKLTEKKVSREELQAMVQDEDEQPAFPTGEHDHDGHDHVHDDHDHHSHSHS
jgi:trigger factor